MTERWRLYNGDKEMGVLTCKNTENDSVFGIEFTWEDNNQNNTIWDMSNIAEILNQRYFSKNNEDAEDLLEELELEEYSQWGIITKLKFTSICDAVHGDLIT